MAASKDPIGPAWRRFAFLYLAIVALGVAAVFAFAGPAYWAVVERLEGPELQKQFGFVAEWRTIRKGWSDLVIVEVRPGGRFAVAGVKAGDVVVCLHHGPGDFWGSLLAARDGREATISVVQMGVTEGCAGARRVRLGP